MFVFEPELDPTNHTVQYMMNVPHSPPWDTHLRATEHHLPHGITLPHKTGERAPLYPQPDRLVLDLPTPEGWKVELTLVS